MRISTRGRYGLRAMVELALEFGQGPTPLRVIAEKQAISEHYLEQLMGNLRKAGLIKSVRGARGGYQLTKKPADISTAEILNALEGPLSPVDCLDQEMTCEQAQFCATKFLWQQLKDELTAVLAANTLEDLRQEALRLIAKREK